MPQINILNILQGDKQSDIVDKINYNFDQILSAGGGPQGARGLIGPTGPVGPQGTPGVQGLQGPSGSKWFVQETAPASGGVTGSNPWTFPSLGDYWLDPDSPNQSVYVFTATGWTDTSYGLNSGSLFQKVTPIDIQGSATGQAILIGGATASAQTIVFSDSSVDDYTPGGVSIENLNYEDAKLKIATKDDRTKILSFGRSDLDITPNGSGALNSNYNPYFSWDESTNPSGPSGLAGPNFYSLSFINPKGSIAIKSLGSSTDSGINLLSTSEISAQADDNIFLKVSAVNKGLFVSGSSTQGGFFEFSDQGSSSTPSNQSLAPIFANSVGVGLGLGTGEFKQSGDDARRLASRGNVSISTTASEHLGSMFVGHSTSSNRNLGSLYVGGYGGFGSTGPTIAFVPGIVSGTINTISTTGASESFNRFPQVYVASRDRGPVLQLRGFGTRTSSLAIASPRTVIGDASSEFALETVATTDRISGRYSDISQIVTLEGTSDSFTPIPGGPVFSYQHRIAGNPSYSGATSANEPVFSITTHVIGIAYNITNYAQKTVIQTSNSNPLLILQANSTGSADNNKVSLGARSKNLITVYAATGTTSSSNYGTVTIGANSDTVSATEKNALTQTNFAGIAPVHALTVNGIQTIGDNQSRTRLLDLSATINGSENFGVNSMLKIYRRLYTSVGFSLSGAYPNNYPNGLEIISAIPASPSAPTTSANKSVAIAVTSLNSISGFGNANTNGFYVSDTGQNVSIGGLIDDTTALSITRSGTDYALKVNGPARVKRLTTGGSILELDGTVDNHGYIEWYTNKSGTATSRDAYVGFYQNPGKSFRITNEVATNDPFISLDNSALIFGFNSAASMIIESSGGGVRMTSNIEYWSITSINSGSSSTPTIYWARGTSGATYVGAIPPDSTIYREKDYDQVLTLFQAGSTGYLLAEVYISAGPYNEDDPFVLYNKAYSGSDGFLSMSTIIPARYLFRIKIYSYLNNNKTLSCRIQKFGLT